MFDSGSDPGSTVIRTKRIGSLSIVNSLDVLRQRVLLELARRKAMQDQRQIDANRRILETIGKRSLPLYNRGMVKAADSKLRNGLEYMLEQEEKSHDRNVTPERIAGRVEDWLQTDDSAFRERQDDKTRRVIDYSDVAPSIIVINLRATRFTFSRSYVSFLTKHPFAFRCKRTSCVYCNEQEKWKIKSQSTFAILRFFN